MQNTHVRYMAIDKPLCEQWRSEALSLLDNVETNRYHAYKSKTQQVQFLAARWLVKNLIAQHYHCDPRTVIIRYSKNGKPYLYCVADNRVLQSNNSLHFSISHTQNAVACCLSRHYVGIDVERPNKNKLTADKISKLINSYVSQRIEERLIQSDNRYNREQLFTVFWTALESIVKIKDTSVFHERKSFAENAVVTFNQDAVLIAQSNKYYCEINTALPFMLCVGIEACDSADLVVQIKQEDASALY